MGKSSKLLDKLYYSSHIDAFLSGACTVETIHLLENKNYITGSIIGLTALILGTSAYISSKRKAEQPSA